VTEESGPEPTPAQSAFGALGLGLTLFAFGPTILKSAESTGIGFAAWRMFVGALLYLVVVRVNGQHIDRRLMRDSMLAGTLFGLGIGLSYASIARTTIASSMLILSLRPAVILVLVGPLLRERVRLPTVVWTAVAIGGTAVAALAGAKGDGGQASTAGDLFAVASMLCTSFYLVATKRARATYEAFPFTTAMMFSGGVVLLPLALVAGEGVDPPPAGDWVWLVAMVAIPGVGHVLNNYSVAHLPLAVVSNVGLLSPALASFVGWLLIDAPLTATDLVGMAITLAGLGMVVRTDRRQPISSRPA